MVALNVEVPDGARQGFGTRPVLGFHNLQEHDLFSDDALIDLLDRYPREHLYALTMGTDDTRTDQNRSVAHTGVSGASLLRAVKNGRLWLNITQLHRADLRYGRLIDDLYSRISSRIPGFRPDLTQGTLLLSSPQVLVYYHADAMPSVLWHLRGRKRIWIYPALDERYLRSADLEDIHAGVRHEYLPYVPSYDDEAVVHDLLPGQWISWAQNAPHRVTTLDSVNVSLSTEHFTRESRARARVYVANRFFRTRLGMQGLSARPTGLSAQLKTVVHRIARKAGLDPLILKRHIAELRVDPDAPGGVTALDTTSPGAGR